MSFLHEKVVNLYISYRLDNCLFGAVKLTKNTDPDKCKCSGYGIGFNSRSVFLWSDGSYGKNIIIFEVDNTSSVNIGDRNKNILVLGEGTTESLENATITAEAKYTIIFKELGKWFVLSLPYTQRI